MPKMLQTATVEASTFYQEMQWRQLLAVSKLHLGDHACSREMSSLLLELHRKWNLVTLAFLQEMH
jgi:hypothetical protein